MRISWKIFILLILCSFSIITFYILYNTISADTQVRQSIKERAASVRESFDGELQKRISLISAKSALVAADVSLVNELSKGRAAVRSKLVHFLKLATVQLESVDTRNEFYFVTDLDRRLITDYSAFADADKKPDHPFAKNASRGKARDGITLYDDSRLMIASARPIQVDESVIGVSFSGRFIDTALLHDIRVHTGFSTIILRNGGVYASDIAITEKSLDTDSLRRIEAIPDQNNTATIDIVVNNDTYRFAFFSIRDTFSGASLGSVLSGFSISPVLKKQGETILINITIGCILTIAILILGFFLARGISRPVKRISAAFHHIAAGEADLSQHIPVKAGAKDEIAELSKWFNLFVDKIRDIIIMVKNSSAKINEVSSTLNEFLTAVVDDVEENQKTILQIVQEIEKQATFTTQTTGNTMTTLSSIQAIFQNLENQTAQVNAVSDKNIEIDTTNKNVQSIIRDAETLSTELATGTQSGIENILSTMDSIRSLQEYSKKVIQVMSLISDMAERINILSINASIESTKAQSAGRGFGVIAREIRTLAAESFDNGAKIIDAVKNINARITDAASLSRNANSELSRMIDRIGTKRTIVGELYRLITFQAGKTDEIVSLINYLKAISDKITGEAKDQLLMNMEISNSMNLLNESITEISSSLTDQKEFGDRINGRCIKLRSVLVENTSLALNLANVLSRFKTD